MSEDIVMGKITILVVEDDAYINRLLCKIMEDSGYHADAAYSGSEAQLRLSMQVYDLVLLDLMLPGISGEELLKIIRESSYMPVIIISAKTELQEKITLLKSGADDYITKPFEKSEVSARVEAQLRRSKRYLVQRSTQAILRFRDLTLDIDSRAAFIAGKPLSLTAREFDLLAVLVQQPNRVFTREELYRLVWNEKYAVEDNTINVHMSNIRSKLLKIAPDIRYIETVWGIGFKMV